MSTSDKTSLALVLQFLGVIDIVHAARCLSRSWERASRERLAWTHSKLVTTYERFALIPPSSIPHLRKLELQSTQQSLCSDPPPCFDISTLRRLVYLSLSAPPTNWRIDHHDQAPGQVKRLSSHGNLASVRINGYSATNHGWTSLANINIAVEKIDISTVDLV